MSTQAQQIKDLRAKLAAAEERAARVRSYYYPWPNHPVSDHFGVTVRTHDGKQWAILLELGLGHTHSWNGTDWVKRSELPHTEVYRWTLAETEAICPELAEKSEKEHPPTEPGRAERELADELNDIIRKSRTAVEAFAAEPVEDIYARLLGGAEHLAEYASEAAA